MVFPIPGIPRVPRLCVGRAIEGEREAGEEEQRVANIMSGPTMAATMSLISELPPAALQFVIHRLMRAALLVSCTVCEFVAGPRPGPCPLSASQCDPCAGGLRPAVSHRLRRKQ